MLRLLRTKIFKPFLVLLIAGTVTLFIGTAGNFTAHANPLDQELSSLQQEIEEKKEEINRLNKELDEILASKRSLSSKISLVEKKIAELERLSEEYNKQIDELIAQLKQQEKEIEKRKQELVLNNVLFYLQTEGNLVFLVLDSNDLNDIIDRFTAFVLFQRRNKREITKSLQRIENIQNQIKTLEASKEKVSDDIMRFKRELAELEAERKRLAVIAAQKSAVISSLTQEVAALSKRAQQIIRQKALANLGNQTTGGNNLPTGGTVTPDSDPYYLVKIGSNEQRVKGPLTFAFTENSFSPNKYFQIMQCSESSCKYYGSLVFRKDANVYVINVLPMDHYLYGLGEMPSSWPQEALKAQAVAGRTYAYFKIKNPRNAFYHIVDITADQNYVGASKILDVYGTNWKTAVDSTSGEIIRKDGALINAWYHSTCGGHTLSSAEVWGGYRSYAVAKSDRYLLNGKWVGYDKDSPRYYWFAGDTRLTYLWIEDLIDATIYLIEHNLSPSAQDAVGCGPSSCVGRWYDFRLGNIKNLLGDRSISARVGTIVNIQMIYNDGSTTITKDSRYTKTLRIIGNKGTYDIDAQVFKLVYNIRSPGKNWIASRLFDVVKISHDDWKVYSYGWGHRVGLCQYGARGRALAGQKYTQIISHYYNGSVVSKEIGNPLIRVGLLKAGSDITSVVATSSFYILDGDGNIVFTVNPGVTVDVIR